jgi:hypothetical protein
MHEMTLLIPCHVYVKMNNEELVVVLCAIDQR